MGKILHASGSGYFPTCIQDGDGFWSIEKAMEIYWRVRTWSASASGTYTLVEDEPQNWSYSLSGITSLATQEEDLVCGENAFEENLDPEEFPTALIQCLSIEKSGSLYNPISFLDIDGPLLSFPIQISGPFSSATPIEPDREAFISLSIFGSTGALWRFSLPTEGTLTGTFSLTPTEWWSYGGTYDTSTGEPL